MSNWDKDRIKAEQQRKAELQKIEEKLQTLGGAGMEHSQSIDDQMERVRADNDLALFIRGIRYQVFNRMLSFEMAEAHIEKRMQEFAHKKMERMYSVHSYMQGKPAGTSALAAGAGSSSSDPIAYAPAHTPTEAQIRANTYPDPPDPAKAGIKVKLVNEKGEPLAGVPYTIAEGRYRGVTPASGEVVNTRVSSSEFVNFNGDPFLEERAVKRLNGQLSEVLNQLVAQVEANAKKAQEEFDRKYGTSEIRRAIGYDLDKAFYLGKGFMEGMSSMISGLLEATKKVSNVAGELAHDPIEALQKAANALLETGHAMVDLYIKVRLLSQDKDTGPRLANFAKKIFAICQHYPAYSTEKEAEFLGSGAVILCVMFLSDGASSMTLLRGTSEELATLRKITDKLVTLKQKLAKMPNRLARYRKDIAGEKAEIVEAKAVKVKEEIKASRFESLAKIGSLAEAKAALGRMREVLASTRHYVAKYTDKALLARVASGEMENSRFLASFMIKDERGSLHFVPPVSETGVGKVWMTDLDGIMEADTDPRLITSLLGAPYNPEARYELHIIDTARLAEGEMGRTFSPTWEKVSKEGSELLDKVADPEVFQSVMQESYKDTYASLMDKFWVWTDEQKKAWAEPLKEILKSNNRQEIEDELLDLGVSKENITDDLVNQLQNSATREQTVKKLANDYGGFHQFNDKATRSFFNQYLGIDTSENIAAKTRHTANTELGCNPFFAGNGITERDTRFLREQAKALVPDKKYGAVEMLSVFRATRPELLMKEAPKLDDLRNKGALITVDLNPITGLE